MLLDIHGTQYGLSQYTKFYKMLQFNWLCSETSKCNVDAM